MIKKEARKIFLKKRDDIEIHQKLKWDDLILIQFQSVDFPYLDHVFSFYPMEDRNEVNTFLITDYLHFKNPNLQISYPRTDLKAGTMDAIACQADSIFQANEINLLEPVDTDIVAPEKLDMVILPLVIADMKGNRVGYGKGYYDKYLKQCREDCIKVGVCYFEPVDLIEDANEFDVPLDFCITPERAYVF
jgi:5-formyltetrahydrofolate cyclo-ligase